MELIVLEWKFETEDDSGSGSFFSPAASNLFQYFVLVLQFPRKI